MKCSGTTKTGKRCKNGANCPIHKSAVQRGGGFLIKSIIPYIGSIYEMVATGKVPSPLSIISAIKEQKYQYDELLKDVENAFDYYNEIKGFMTTASYKRLCNVGHFEKVFRDFEKLLASMNDDSTIRKLFNKQILTLNRIVLKYDQTKNIKGYVEDINKAYAQAQQVQIPAEFQGTESLAFDENVLGATNEMFVKSYPTWYRAELNYVINRLNVMIDSLSIKSRKQCVKPTKLKTIEPQQIDFTRRQQQQFFDALTDYTD